MRYGNSASDDIAFNDIVFNDIAERPIFARSLKFLSDFSFIRSAPATAFSLYYYAAFLN